MSSVSTALKVHYNQKLGGGHPAIFGGNAPWPLGGLSLIVPPTHWPCHRPYPLPTHRLLTNDRPAAPPNARQLLTHNFNMFMVIN